MLGEEGPLHAIQCLVSQVHFSDQSQTGHDEIGVSEPFPRILADKSHPLTTVITLRMPLL